MARREPAKQLRRRGAVRRAAIKITVFCEGENTEPAYFRALAVEVGNGLVEIEIGSERGVPLTLIKAAVAEKRKRARAKRDSFELRDQIWAVFDRDEHPNFVEAMTMARDNKLLVALSDPCFELWAIIHLEEHDAPIDRHSAQARLAKLMPSYKKSGAKHLDYKLMSGKHEVACNRAESMEKRRNDEGAKTTNPSTGIYKLVRVIVENGNPLKAVSMPTEP